MVAEGLESFWTLRKGEGCLGGTGPDTAAMEWVEMGGDRYRWKKSVDRAIEGEGGCVSGRRPMGGRLLIEKKGRGEGRDTRHRNLSRGSHFCSGVTAGQSRFDAPRFIHSAKPRGFQPAPRIRGPPTIGDMTAHWPPGPCTSSLLPSIRKK